MKRFLFVAACLYVSGVMAQSNQMNQTPLLYHASFAGATGGARVAVNGDVSRFTEFNEKVTASSCYLSAHHLYRGIGLGLSLTRSNKEFGDFYKGISFKSMHVTNGIQIAIAPKYLLKKVGNSAKYTLSPSLSVGYAKQVPRRGTFFIGESDSRFPNITWGHTPEWYKGGVLHLFQPYSQWRFVAGLMLNSATGYVGVNYQHSMSTYQIIYTDYAYDYTLDYSVYSVMAGKTFKNRPDSKFSFTPQLFAAVGTFYRKNGFSTTTFFLDKAVVNLTFNYDKWFLGTGLTLPYGYGVTFFSGYQNERFRAAVHYNTNPGLSESEMVQGGLSFSYFFKKS